MPEPIIPPNENPLDQYLQEVAALKRDLELGERPPFKPIARALRSGRVIPFLGAGVNLGPGTAPLGAKALRLPSGFQLSSTLALEAYFPAESLDDLNDLAKVASYYVDKSGRPSLREMLHETFNQDYTPRNIHEYLAEIERPLLIVTTNYDDLTERAFEAKKRPYDLVVHPTDRPDLKGSVFWWQHGAQEPIEEEPNSLPMTERLKKMTVIYKMHGTVVRPWFRRQASEISSDDLPFRDDSYVITEEDYIDFLHRMTMQAAVPAEFMTYFSTRQFLFLGYGLRDWNLRVVLKNLKSVLRGPGRDDEAPSWAIQFKPSLLEWMLWKKRNVNIYNMDVDEFVDELRKH
jgi:SIR2-like domain